MKNILLRSSLRYIRIHVWQFLLSILGIALGVAVAISMDIANESSKEAFTISTQTVTGKSTHQITGPPGGLSEEIYKKLRLEGKIRHCAPVVEGFLSLPDHKGQILHLLGIDAVVDSEFRPYLKGIKGSFLANLTPFMTEPFTAIISSHKAKKLGLKEGDFFTVRSGSLKHKILLTGLIESADKLTEEAMENLIVTDIATAQEILDITGRISSIDLIITEEWQLEDIKKKLPPSVKITPARSRSQAIEHMTRAFNLNLTALSTLALIVGMFLIYNTMTFSVVQRRTMIGMLRAIGVTRQEIFRFILGEALITGVLGTITGIAAGIFLGKGMVSLVSKAINDIYFVLSVTHIAISPLTILKGIILGIFSTLMAALLPALEATSAPPRTVISRSEVEKKLHFTLLSKAISGISLLLLASVMIHFSEKSLIFSIGSLFVITLGFALLTPVATVIFTLILIPVTGCIFGIMGRMSARGIISSLSRTSVAIAALMIAVSVTVSVGIMVGSLRHAVIIWMETFLKADIYVSPPSLVYSRSDLTLDRKVLEKFSSLSEISFISTYRGVMVESEKGLNQLIAITVDPKTYHSFRFKEGKEDKIWPGFTDKDEVIVSEPYAYLHGTEIGSKIHLNTDRGEHDFPVAGIFYDYTSDRGIVVMNRKTYDKFWNDRNVSSLAIYVRDGVNIDKLIEKMERSAGSDQVIAIQSNRELRETTLGVFDRTFIITDVLKILSIIVAFIGVLSALMALQLERSKEIAVLRATGLTPSQVWKIVIIQTALIGIIAGFMALILGIVIAVVLIFVINRISFGWTMEMVISPGILIQAFIISLSASILAGIYPSIKMANTSPAQALREE
jgi:putative ABC transport system permease protein